MAMAEKRKNEPAQKSRARTAKSACLKKNFAVLYHAEVRANDKTRDLKTVQEVLVYQKIGR
jgi:hypothetical protein